MKVLKLLQYNIFVPDSNLLSCKLDNFSFKVLHWVILYIDNILKQNNNTFTVPSEKSKMVSFSSPIMKKLYYLQHLDFQ